MHGLADAFFAVLNSTLSATFRDCIFSSVFDGFVCTTAGSDTVFELIDCQVFCNNTVNSARGIYTTDADCTIRAWNTSVRALSTGAGATAVDCGGGTIELFGGSVYGKGTTSSDLTQTSGTLRVIGVEYDRSKTSGTIIKGSGLDSAMESSPTADSIMQRIKAIDVLTEASGGGDLATIKAVTDVLPNSGALTDIGTDTARLTAVRAAILTDWINDGRLDLLLDAIPTTAMRGTDSAGVNAEVVDVLRTDTVSELAAVPAASPSLHAMVQFVYMTMRNQLTSTATASTVANDAGSAIGTSADSDDATTFTRGKLS
jgi:hypothetical protein